MSAKLGESLLKDNLITPQQLKEALDYQRVNGGRLASTLVKLCMLSDEEVTAVLSRQYGVPSVNLDLFEVDPAAVALVPQETAERYSVLPLSRVGATLTLAMVDPTNVFAIDDIKFMTGLSVEPVVVSETALNTAIRKYYGSTREMELAKVMEDLVAESTSLPDFGDDVDQLELENVEEEIDLENLERMSEDAPVVKLVNVVLVDALRRGASDIHIEPYEKEFRIRFRMDGILYNIMAPPMKMRDALTSRLKIMARLDIAEKRLPQDGRIKIRVRLENRSRELDFRVSTLPTIFGEKMVLRLLDKENLRLDMTQLGFEPESLEKFKRNISRPYGMVLVTGPTGSGKTSTLYSALQSLNTPETNIMTAEDPVEFNLPGINRALDWVRRIQALASMAAKMRPDLEVASVDGATQTVTLKDKNGTLSSFKFDTQPKVAESPQPPPPEQPASTLPGWMPPWMPVYPATIPEIVSSTVTPEGDKSSNPATSPRKSFSSTRQSCRKADSKSNPPQAASRAA